MASYLAELVARTPSLSGPPAFEVISPIKYANLACSWELSRDGSCDLSTTVRQLDPEARFRLSDPWTYPCELRVTRDGSLWWQGPVWTVGLQGSTVTLHARGLMAYLRGMVVGPDTGTLIYTGVDQHLIVKGLIDAWQALDYGHYGLDTTHIGTSGRVRDRLYPASELQEVYRLVSNLTEVQDGMDVEVRADRTVRCHHPVQGTTKALFLDARNISSADEHRSVADGRAASVAYVATSTQPDEAAPLAVAAAEDATALASFGRWAYAATRDGVTEQSTLDGYAAAALDARRTLDWQPAPGLRPVRELAADAVEVGDTIGYRYDAGLGLVDRQVRVVSKQVKASEGGAESLEVAVA